jgi:hypothetical protein
MTPERMNYVMEVAFRRRRQESLPAYYAHCARFLGVQPITLRRWMRGERPIPRMVEVIMEIFHAWPDVVGPQAVDKLIEERDRRINALAGQK